MTEREALDERDKAIRQHQVAQGPSPAHCAAVEDANASMEQRMDTLEEEVLHVESLLRSEEAESGRLRAREAALLARASALQNELNRAGDRIAALEREADKAAPAPVGTRFSTKVS